MSNNLKDDVLTYFQLHFGFSRTLHLPDLGLSCFLYPVVPFSFSSVSVLHGVLTPADWLEATKLNLLLCSSQLVLLQTLNRMGTMRGQCETADFSPPALCLSFSEP